MNHPKNLCLLPAARCSLCPGPPPPPARWPRVVFLHHIPNITCLCATRPQLKTALASLGPVQIYTNPPHSSSTQPHNNIITNHHQISTKHITPPIYLFFVLNVFPKMCQISFSYCFLLIYILKPPIQPIILVSNIFFSYDSPDIVFCISGYDLEINILLLLLLLLTIPLKAVTFRVPCICLNTCKTWKTLFINSIMGDLYMLDLWV